MSQKEDKSYKNLVDFWKNIESKNTKTEKKSTKQMTPIKQEKRAVKDGVPNILNKNENVKEKVKDEHKDKVPLAVQKGITKDKKLITPSVIEKPKQVAETDKKPTNVFKTKSPTNKGKVEEEKSKVISSKTKISLTKEIKTAKEKQSIAQPVPVRKIQGPKEDIPKEKVLEGGKVRKEKIKTEKSTVIGDKETLNIEIFNEEKTKIQKEKPKKETNIPVVEKETNIPVVVKEKTPIVEKEKTPIVEKEKKSEVEETPKKVEITNPPLLNEIKEQIKESKKILNGCKESLKECKEEFQKTEKEIQKDLEDLQAKISDEEKTPTKQVDSPKDPRKFRKRRVTIIDPDIVKRALEITDDEKPVEEQPKTIEVLKQEILKEEVDTPKKTRSRSRENRMSVINIQDLQTRQTKVDELKNEENLLIKEKELFNENSQFESISLSDLKKVTAPKPRARDRRMSVVDLARMYSNKSDDEDL